MSLGPNRGPSASGHLAGPAVGLVLAAAAAAVAGLEKLSTRYLPRLEDSLRVSRDRVDPPRYHPGAPDLHTLDFTLTPERADIVARHVEMAKRRTAEEQTV